MVLFLGLVLGLAALFVPAVFWPENAPPAPARSSTCCCGRLSARRDALLAEPRPVCPYPPEGSTAVPRYLLSVDC